MGKKYPKSPKVTISITKELIEASKVRNSSHCMIAQAVKEAFPTASRVMVDLQSVRFTDPKKGLRYTYLTPERAKNALIEFDQGRIPPPFTCTLAKAHITRANIKNLGVEEKAAIKNVSGRDPRNRPVIVHRKNKVDNRPPRGSGGCIPELIGGRPPPIGKFATLRRFGLRMLTP